MWRDAAIVAAAAFTAGWLGAASAATLILVWRVVPRTEGPPVLQLALTTQWVQVSLGVFYTGLTSRELRAQTASTYEEMILIGLASVAVLAIGVRVGGDVVAARKDYPPVTPEELASLPGLVAIYGCGVAVTALLQEVAFIYPTLTQAILALSYARLALIYLMLRRLSRPVLRWELIAALLAFEVGLGFTGYFSSFKEPLLLAALVMLESFDARRAAHWATALVLAAALGMTTYMWMSVRTEYRQDFADEAFAASRSARLERMQALVTDWLQQSDTETAAVDMDNFVDRVWAVYYPALALERVPAVIPHTDGILMQEVLIHLLTPRLLFPDKPDLPSDSELVRKYSGVLVAGAERDTSIAFGYPTESYVDFGIPLMFVPILLLGLFAGALHEWLLRSIGHRDLAIAVATSIVWVNLNLFERSWAKMIGFLLTMVAYLGLVAWITDRWLLMKYSGRFPHDEREFAYTEEP